jgi:putative oxidoreductase
MPDIAVIRAAWEPRVLSLLRIMVGLLYMQHGLNKLFGFPSGANPRPYVLMTLVPGLAGILEAVGGLLLALGLFTRIAAFILSGEMSIAYFMAHAPRGLYPYSNGGSLAVLYCFVFFYLTFAGGGPWALDRMRPPRGAANSSRG